MSSEPKYLPPRWATRLLSWYCRIDLLEDLQGDLNEYFERHVKEKGLMRARLIYVADVLKFFRPYTIRKPKFINLLIQWIMIGSYLKTSGRNIRHNKLFSTINIAGLAVSMSVGLLLIGILTDMNSYDRFHKKGDRIYRVKSQFTYLGKTDNNYYASSSPLAGQEIKESLPGTEAVALLHRGFHSDVKAGETTVPIQGLWADEGLFQVFSFQLLKGNPATALKNPFSLILTESAAIKLFGQREAFGQTVNLLDNQNFTVTGVMRDVPKFSHIQFEMLGSLSTREIISKDRWEKEMKWDNIWSGYTYLLLPENANLEAIQQNFDTLCEKYDKTIENTNIKLGLQPLYDIALGEDMNNAIGPIMGKSTVWVIGGLTLVVILSACFNYTNLSIARATRRSREVGIRKVIGALKSNVLTQFMVEAVLIALLSLVLALLLFILLKPFFISLNPEIQKMLSLDLSPLMVFYFVVMAVCVGAVSGFLPAYLFSRINIVQVLKSSSSFRLFRHLNLRKTLIVVQFTISLTFIAATIIGFKQYKYLLAFDLGYDTENIVNIDLQGNKATRLANALRELPEVQNISESEMLTSVGNYWGTRMKYNDPQDSAVVYFNGIDENYLPLHQIKLKAGRNFTALPDSAEESEVIVSEEVLKRFNIAGRDPLKALDEIVTVEHNKMKIIGVVQDFHYGKADVENTEVIFRYRKGKGNFLNVKVATGDWLGTLSKIEAAWKKIDTVHPLEAQLYSDRIQQSYREISSMLQILGFLSFLAICIASLGLLGMVIFVTETRLKEISIRKVMGASEAKLIYLLSHNFLTLLVIAGAIALPATYLFFDQVAFMEMKNHITIGVGDLMAGFLAVLTLALVMIGSQTLKIARSNPAEVLKNE